MNVINMKKCYLKSIKRFFQLIRLPLEQTFHFTQASGHEYPNSVRLCVFVSAVHVLRHRWQLFDVWRVKEKLFSYEQHLSVSAPKRMKLKEKIWQRWVFTTIWNCKLIYKWKQLRLNDFRSQRGSYLIHQLQLIGNVKKLVVVEPYNAGLWRVIVIGCLIFLCFKAFFVHLFYSYSLHDKFIIQPKDSAEELIINRINGTITVQGTYSIYIW